MSAKEQHRAMVFNQVERREITGQQAAALIGLSLRQVRRLLAGYRKEGVAALAHGNRGRGPVHAIPEETRKRVVALAQDPYGGFNHYHLQAVSKFAREAAEFVNLYSKSRGINRFPALIETLQWLQKR